MRILALAAAVLTSACATVPDAPIILEPATVVVGFDRDSIEPLIVEGIADRNTGRMVEVNDPVRIASISKLIMAMATLRLVDESKIDLDRDVSDYLGWTLRHPDYPDDPVTLRQLLSHTSALRDDAGYVIALGESLQARLADPSAWYVDAPPGEAPFEYANLGSAVVATALEGATGERYDRLVERTVFVPLDIEACFNWIGCDPATMASAVTLYRSTGEVARDAPDEVMPPACTFPVFGLEECRIENYVPGTNASIFSPQGGLRIGMMDLAKIGQALLRDKNSDFLSEALFGEWVNSAFSGVRGDQEFFCAYGLGVQVIQLPGRVCEDRLFPDDAAYLGHAGEAYGLRSGLWFEADGNRGFAYFTTAVPPRTSAEDEGGFDPREIDLMARAMRLSTKSDR